MPELPEVETVRRHLAEHLTQAELTSAEFGRSDLRYPMPVAAIQAMVGCRLVTVARRSKYLVIDCVPAAGDATTVLIHLGMSGRLFIDDVAPLQWRKHEHWRWTLQTAQRVRWLRYVDARRFGMLAIAPAGRDHPLLARLGPEPLGAAFSAAHLHAGLARRSIAVKVAIMDAALVVGVGNIYASESCFRAGIAPARAANQVTVDQSARLWQAIVAVLTDAIAAGGSTLRDFVGGDESPGYFQQQLGVYGRAGMACQRCARFGTDSAVVRAVLGQRATFWCPACQT